MHQQFESLNVLWLRFTSPLWVQRRRGEGHHQPRKSVLPERDGVQQGAACISYNASLMDVCFLTLTDNCNFPTGFTSGPQQLLGDRSSEWITLTAPLSLGDKDAQFAVQLVHSQKGGVWFPWQQKRASGRRQMQGLWALHLSKVQTGNWEHGDEFFQQMLREKKELHKHD